MTDKFIILAFMTFFHDLFTSIWIGGMFTLGLTVFPSIKKVLGMGPQTIKLINVIQKKLSKFAYVSIAGLFVTGAVKAKMVPEFQGLLQFGNTYSFILGLKHILVILMVIIAILRSQFIGRNMKGPDPKIVKIKALMLMLNMFFALLVLLLSAFSTVIT
jgi:uncharacterized membrane protein